MKKTKSISMILAGALIGVGLAGPAANAATEYFQAERTVHPIYVDGRQVQLEAYNIGGSNYVKLRDVGQVVGFEVYWDGSAAQVFSDKPYTGEPSAQKLATTAATDYSQAANSAIFRGSFSPEAYNTIRAAIMTGQTTSFGSSVKGFIGLKYDDKAELQKAEQEIQQLDEIIGKLGLYPGYRIESAGGEYLCRVDHSDRYLPVEEHTRGFISSLSGLSDREKVKRIVWYVDDRIAYDITCYAWPDKVLAQDGVVHGACMSYAYSVQYLCRQAGILCILVSGGNHQWNMVYAEGRWWDVDATANDCDGVDLQTYGSGVAWEEHLDFDGTDSFRERFYVTADQVLWDRTADPYLSSHTDEQPEYTRIAQELLAPGSTR